ncbi:MAG: PAS domain S-box protein [Bacteroidales bacterium]|nr:PAS domain S-box protein [Bacteroidales bacterium]
MKDNILDLIDFEKVNLLLEGFNKSTGFVTAILDLEGNILSKSGWRQICTEFHRVHTETAKKCKISDTVLAGKLGKGEKYHSYKCLNGLVDVAVPIIINDEHIANLFSGQFFFEKPNRDFFIKQAEKYNFKKKDYLEALDKVPVVSEEKVKTAMDFLLEMTLLITEMSQQRIDQIELNKTLKESEERFRILYNNSPDMYVSVSPVDASILQCNETLLKNLDYAREEIIGAHVYKVYHKSCIAEVKNAFRQFVETGEVSGKELILKRKDGSSIDVSLNVNSVKDENGKILYSISSWRDISAQKKAIEELKKEKQFLEAVFDSISEGIVSCDANGILNRFNNATKEFHGLPDMPIAADKWAEHYNIFFPDGKTPMQKKDIPLFRAFTEGVAKDVEMMIIPKDGSKRLLVSNGKVLKDSDGKTLGAVVAMHDITERKQAEEKLKESEEKFRTFVNTASDLMCITNKDGQLTDVNSAMVDILDYSIEELKEMHISNLLTKEALKNDFEPNWKKFVEDGKIKIETTFKTKSGNEIPGELKAIAIYNSSDKIIGTRAVFSDFTERKQAEAALLESEEKFRLAFKTSPDSVNINRLEDGLYVDINDSFTQITGYTREETIGKTSNEINIWTNFEDRTRLVKRLKKSGKVENLEAKFKLKDNRIIVGLMSAVVISINNVPHILSITRDISNLKHTEIELKKQKEMFELVINSVPTRIFWKDLNSVYLGCNSSFVKAVRQNKVNDVIGKTDFDLIWSNEAEKYINDDKQVIKSGVPKLRYDEYYLLPDGKKVWWHSSKMPLKDSDGKIFGILATSEDVTERKEFLKTLQERNTYIESILGNMPIGFALNTISDGDVKYMNNNFEEIYGWSRDVLTNTSIFFEKVFPNPEYRKKMKAKIIADMESGDPERMNWKDIKIVTRSGEERYVHAYNIPLIEQNLMISTVQDTTKRRLAEDEVIKHRNHLEELVKARTAELEEKNKELENFNKVFVGRELRMIELKNKIKELENKNNKSKSN